MLGAEGVVLSLSGIEDERRIKWTDGKQDGRSLLIEFYVGVVM